MIEEQIILVLEEPDFATKLELVAEQEVSPEPEQEHKPEPISMPEKSIPEIPSTLCPRRLITFSRTIIGNRASDAARC